MKTKEKHWTEIGKERFNLHKNRLNLEEFNLSELGILHLDDEDWIKVKNVKEFIRRQIDLKPKSKEEISEELRNETHKNLFYNGYLLGLKCFKERLKAEAGLKLTE